MELLAIRLSAIKHALSRWLWALLLARGPPLWEMPGAEPGKSDPQGQSAPDYDP